MKSTTFLAALAALAVAALAWQRHDPSAFRALTTPASTALERPRSSVTPSGPVPAGLRKCRGADGALTYTNGACPHGSRAESIGAGTLTVVSGQRPPTTSVAADAGASRSLMRTLAGPDLGDLKQKQIDRAIGQ